MKETANRWFEGSANAAGILACGLRHPDNTTLTNCGANGFSDELVTNGMRCAADMFEVLRLNRIDYGRLCWIYSKAGFHCERRPDGMCLGIFLPVTAMPGHVAAMDQLFQEFQNLKAPHRGPDKLRIAS